jgi:hypothetical protein
MAASTEAFPSPIFGLPFFPHGGGSDGDLIGSRSVGGGGDVVTSAGGLPGFSNFGHIIGQNPLGSAAGAAGAASKGASPFPVPGGLDPTHLLQSS